MLIWSQGKGELRTLGGELVAKGYAGAGAGKNNPAAQTQRAIGPIPRGFWRIGKVYDSKNTGPHTIPVYKLDSKPTDDVDEVTGRSAFRIHGDSASRPGQASQGCIILPLLIRKRISGGLDEILWVQE